MPARDGTSVTAAQVYGLCQCWELVMTSNETMTTSLSGDEFAHLGHGALAYVKPIKSDEVAKLFPLAPAIQPGLDLFLLLGADGVPIMLTDSKDAALSNAWEHQLQTVSLH